MKKHAWLLGLMLLPLTGCELAPIIPFDSSSSTASSTSSSEGSSSSSSSLSSSTSSSNTSSSSGSGSSSASSSSELPGAPFSSFTLKKETSFDKLTTPLTGSSEFLSKYSINLASSDRGSLSSTNTNDYFGNRSILKATPNNGYRFAFFLRNGFYLEPTANSSLIFNFSFKNDFEAVYVKEENKFVLFLDENGKMLSYTEVAAGSKVDLYNYPVNDGYDLSFNEKVSKLSNVAYDMIFVPKYTKKGKPSLTLDGALVTPSPSTYDDLITIKPDDAASSSLFNAFSINGQMASLSTPLKIKAIEDMEIKTEWKDVKDSFVPLTSMMKEAKEYLDSYIVT